MQSTLLRPPTGIHVGIIMDGNGRWAEARGRPRVVGHREGTRAVRRVVEAAPDLGIGTLTMYAFSSDNWQRPPTEVTALMSLFRRHLRSEVKELVEQGVRLTVIGRRDRLSPPLVSAIDHAERETRDGRTLRMRLAIDYSARDAIVAAARRAAARPSGESGARIDKELFASFLGDAVHEGEPVRDVDLLIRTGGEQRLSDFLLWEAAYAELLFTDCMWPDFGPTQLATAVAEFRGRDRRFGRVGQAAV
ncbi:MAG: di-trans,poly-cis-decaprenylcistransferase [Gemmatimonadetes bacterium]|nr:di-trans,poly-cis-decaprenylcistransferase [Gemmatimonadota bacterium]